MILNLVLAWVQFSKADVYSGSVASSTDSKPIGGVSITLKGKPGITTSTDSLGAFSISNTVGIYTHNIRKGTSDKVTWNSMNRSLGYFGQATPISIVLRNCRGQLIEAFTATKNGEYSLVGKPEGLISVAFTSQGIKPGAFSILNLPGAGTIGYTIQKPNGLAKSAGTMEANVLVFEKIGYLPLELPVDGDTPNLKVKLLAAPAFAGTLFKTATDRVEFNVKVGLNDTQSNVKATVTGTDLNVQFLKPNTETYGSTGSPKDQKQNNFVFDLGKEIDGSAYKSLKFHLQSNVGIKVWIFCGKLPVTDPQVLTYLKPADGTTDYYSIPAGVNEDIELSLDSNFIGLDKTRLHGFTFRTAAGEGCPLERACTSWPDMQMTLSNVRMETGEVFKPRVKHPFAPPAGKKYLVIGQGIDGIDNFYAKKPVNRPAGIMSYLSTFDWNFGWGDYGGSQSGIDARRILLNPAYDGTVLQIGLGMALSDASGNILNKGCKEIVDGKYDIYLDVVSDRLKQMKRPIFLRLNHELDNPNHLCSSPQNLGTEYAGAVAHIVDRFHRRGVNNVAYVMHFWTWSNQQNWSEWLKLPFVEPYMDWIGVSSLTDGVDAANMNSIMSQTTKPVMIAEFARNGGPTPEWISSAFQYSKSTAKVKMTCLINQNANYGPVKFGEFSANLMANYETAAADPAFLKQNDIKFIYSEMSGTEMSW
jgi:hypothetical protein